MVNKRIISKDYLIKLMYVTTDKEFKQKIFQWLQIYDKIVIREDTSK